MQDKARAKLVEICRSWPEVTSDGDQHLRFAVRNKTFAYYLDDHHGDGLIALCCKAAPGEQEALLASNPERFYIPSYLGSRGWISLRLDLDDVDWDEVAEIALEAYRLTAPKRLRALVDPST
ncbi:MAG: MmcQ/YjbR family DNA-binding protein [Actinobacteria bacterium]|nr:MmcQ/YjbR family DNA-binding protein [Actinomycetota bacterium]